MKLALIPARGGSERIPRKNIRLFAGRPIITYSIEAAKDADLFSRIIVSTDDEEIATIAETHGAEVPFRRPSEFSSNVATTIAVVQHALRWAEQEQLEVELLCCLYPTAPFIRTEDIRSAHNLIQVAQADYCFPVTNYPSPIQRAVRIRQHGRLEMFDPESFSVRSQDLEPAYHDAGQFYWGRPHAFLTGTPFFGAHAVALRIPSWRVCDIDTPDDWTHAELLFETLKRRGEL